MKLVARGLIVAALLLSTACNTVHSTRPVGTEVHALDAAAWNGTWLMGDGSSCTIRVLDGEAGQLEAAIAAADDGRLKTHVLQVRLRDHGDWTFASIEDPEQPGLHLWMRVWREEGQLILWIPNPDKLAALVESGVLQGRLDGRNVVLTSLDEDQLPALHASLDEGLLEWEHPLAMIRVSRAD